MDPLSQLVAAAGAIAGSLVLGSVKKYTTVLDGRIGGFVKPVQPLLVLASAVALPWVAQHTGIVPPDPQQFISAPTATILTIAAREALNRLKPKEQ